MKRVQDKVAVVTGGSRGIGRATCKVLAEEGAKVAVTDIIDDEGQELVRQITTAGGTADYWHLNVANEESVKQVFEEIQKQFGNITVLVNNAGIAGSDKPTHELTEKEWSKVMDVNVKGVFLCTKHVIPQMQEAGGGSIINLSSIYGLVGAPDIPPYHASKGATALMSKTDALLYAKQNIRVNSVHPGYIWTPLVEDLAKRSEQGLEDFRNQLASLHPVGHVGEPDDIAYGIVYLASDESKFVTGSELVIDGGYTAQ
ncbi:glucose 1-dehydrogenase [candidate division KSB3 bacterium]|uniref:Glucose 1-dehydrogenase n=1 Tax=candidate division KSB3 bacterium TaxID=2044937 RepID=A0A9D5JRP7_9BACT|nr:glucose 1-dehydrogenase [candidate division KSB3 bacterium]MBD3323028.1 glucose 1-dehydrogenase [candidate division KSB3 bacterium]